MPEPLDHIVYLSQEVGPRPAGTEEEQQAALYITEQLQKEAGFSASIEDFRSEANGESPRVLCALLTLACTVLALFFSVLAIPSLIIAALAAFVYVMETLGHPVISRFFASGVSQNVIAKYEPGYSPKTGSSRRRKIILVANYDSGKVNSELKGSFLTLLPFLQKAILVAMVIVPIFLTVRYFFFLHAEGVEAIVLNSLTAVILLFVAIPLVLAIIHKFAPYNEAANCNASGVAVLLEIARRVGKGAVGQKDIAQSDEDVVIHGEEAARASGLVPEGSQLIYEASQVKGPKIAPQTEADRLASAKAAIAAMTGQPVSSVEQSSIADNLVQVKENPLDAPTSEEVKEIREEIREAFGTIPPETLEDAYAKAESVDSKEGFTAASEEKPLSNAEEEAAPLASDVTVDDPSVPDWFKKAQENAKKPKDSMQQIQRSRYAEALDAAVAESSSYFNQANKAVSNETEERLRKMRDGIMEIQAPQATREVYETPRILAQPQREETKSTSVVEQSAQREAPVQAQVEAPAEVQQEKAPTPQDISGATISMPPIDVSDLRPTEVSSIENVSAEETAKQVTAARHPIVLPDIGPNATSLEPLDMTKQQRAPLAQAEDESSQTAAKSLLNMLPSIEIGEEPAQTNEPAQARPDLKNTLPSLSGALKEVSSSASQSTPATTGSVNAAGSFASPAATGTFKPVGEELLQDVDPNDIYVDDADDSAYEEGMTETGAFAGPGYVEMPKSRVRRFFDKFSFRKNKNNDDTSAKEWLDVDEDFDARSAGAARGGWESFQEENPEEEDFFEGSPEIRKAQYRHPSDDEWEGGAVSRNGMEEGYYDEELYADGSVGYLQSSDEMRQIQQFRNPSLDTEVWFVALGSEIANNGGMKTFLNDYEQDLHGAIVINLEGLASGDLCVLEKEGFRGKGGYSSRMKRYVRKASQATGVSVGSQALTWRESAATIAANRGIQAMTIAGVEGRKPARFAQGDDVLENIDHDILHMNTEFVMELLRSI